MSYKVYLLKVASVLGLLCLMYGGLFLYQLGAPLPAEYWVKDIITVKSYIASQSKENKIIIIAGSNALFSLDAIHIEKSLNVRTINLAMHAGLPLEYLIKYARQFANPKDVIVMPLEYEYYKAQTPYTGWYVNQLMTWATDAYWELGVGEKLIVFMSVPPTRVLTGVRGQLNAAEILEQHPRRRPTSKGIILDHIKQIWVNGSSLNGDSEIYSFKNINDRGDLVVNQRVSYPYAGKDDYGLTGRFDVSPVVLDGLKEFGRYCREQNIGLVITWPPTAKSSRFDIHDNSVQANLDLIIGKVRSVGIDILGKPEDFHYLKDLFYDDSYHLNAMGRQYNTEVLIGHLKTRLGYLVDSETVQGHKRLEEVHFKGHSSYSSRQDKFAKDSVGWFPVQQVADYEPAMAPGM